MNEREIYRLPARTRQAAEGHSFHIQGQRKDQDRSFRRALPSFMPKLTHGGKLCSVRIMLVTGAAGEWQQLTFGKCLLCAPGIVLGYFRVVAQLIFFFF